MEALESACASLVWPKPDRVTGTLCAATSLALMVLSILLATGTFGGGQMYFIGSGLMLGAIAFAIAATCLLVTEPR